MRFDLWGSVTCGQNLDVKELTDRNFEYEGPKRDDSTSEYRPGLGHDRAIEMVGARLDVTRECGKLLRDMFPRVDALSGRTGRRGREANV